MTTQAGAGPLSEDQDTTWHAFLGMSREWFIVMEHALADEAGCSVADLELLEPLLDCAGSGLRAKDLAAAADWQDSRVSHQLKRMEARGLVSRSRDRNDGRGTVVTLTELGSGTALRARDTRRRVVRRLVLDPLTPEQLTVMVTIAERIRAAVAQGVVTRMH